MYPHRDVSQKCHETLFFLHFDKWNDVVHKVKGPFQWAVKMACYDWMIFKSSTRKRIPNLLVANYCKQTAANKILAKPIISGTRFSWDLTRIIAYALHTIQWNISWCWGCGGGGGGAGVPQSQSSSQSSICSIYSEWTSLKSRQFKAHAIQVKE